MELQKQAAWVDEKGLQRRRKVRSGEEEEEEARRTGSRTTVTIKIKISKKKLEERLRQVEGDLEVLRQLLTLWEEQHEKEKEEKEKVVMHWTPELQSIPELPE